MKPSSLLNLVKDSPTNTNLSLNFYSTQIKKNVDIYISSGINNSGVNLVNLGVGRLFLCWETWGESSDPGVIE